MKMTYTGERMVPEDADSNTFWEHIYRYRFALSYVHGKRVLDIACGEGYGSAALLQCGAASVTGVDISKDACEHAASRYGITTKVGDVKSIPLEDKSVDVVVSFETIEHTEAPELFLNECVRVLAPGGKLVISTPNLQSRGEHASVNPFHLRELSLHEFSAALESRFQRVEMYTQRPQISAWWSPKSLAANRTFWQLLPGFKTFRRLMLQFSCREVVNANCLRQAREEPVKAILEGHGRGESLWNPFQVHRYQPASREVPVYFVAVAYI